MMNKEKIIILGSGPSLLLYDYDKTIPVWAPLSMKDEKIDGVVQFYFALHSHQVKETDERIINKDNYPLNDIIKEFKSKYFTNSISYMIAYAMYIGAKEITFHGVDMAGSDEYYNQRGSVMYWVGRAEGSGMKINMPNKIDVPVCLYGLEDEQKKALMQKINILTDWAAREFNASEDQREKDQYAGVMYGLSLLSKEI